MESKVTLLTFIKTGVQ